VYKSLVFRKYKKFQEMHSILFNYGESKKLAESEGKDEMTIRETRLSPVFSEQLLNMHLV
jgi:hypothetical protein